MAVAVALTGVFIGVRLQERLQAPPAPARPPLAVETATVRPAPFVRTIALTGTVVAERSAVISARLAAPLLAVPHREGAAVEAGTVLARLDDAEARREVGRLRAAADAVAADLAFWREQLEADRRLRERNTISRRAFDETARRVASLEAAAREAAEAVANARLRLEYAVVRAPFDGFIQTVHHVPGELVQPGTPLLELLAARPLKAVVAAAQGDVPALARGQAARIGIPAADAAWTGRVDRIHPRLDRATRNATVELFLPAESDGVRPGMMARVAVEVARHPAAITVPDDALRRRGDEQGVYVLSEGTARWRGVTPGVAQSGRTLIPRGLSAGEVIIVTPHPQLTDGRAVVDNNDWRQSLP